MLLLHVATTIAGLRDNGKYANQNDGQLVDHCVCMILFFFQLDVRCTICEKSFVGTFAWFLLFFE